MFEVSCMCLTYGRTWLLEEAIYSFLNQDYDGKKELVILNDFVLQELVFDHPLVRVINFPYRFGSIGEKRNYCASLCRYDNLMVWDDDDIYLSHRLSYSAERFYCYFKPNLAFILNDDILSGPQRNLYHSSGVWSRELFHLVGRYTEMNSGQDIDLERRFWNIPGVSIYDINVSDIYYIYRWSGIGSYHLSGFGKDNYNRNGLELVKSVVDSMVDNGMKIGRIELIPCWKKDYKLMVKDYISKLK